MASDQLFSGAESIGAIPYIDEHGIRVEVPDLGELDAVCDLDGCGARIVNPWIIIVSVANEERVNMAAHWRFCCAEHRSTWWGMGRPEAFWRISDRREHLNPADRWLSVNIIHYDGPETHRQGMALRRVDTGAVLLWCFGELVLSAYLETPDALNRWWSTPNRANVDGLAEILFMKAA